MKNLSRTSMLSVAFAFSLAGLVATAGQTLLGQTTPPDPYVLDDGQPGVTPTFFSRIQNNPSHGGFLLMYTRGTQTTSKVDYLFSNLDQAADYEVYATWEPLATFSANVPHVVVGATEVTTLVSQKLEPIETAPNGTVHLNRPWQKIATIKPSSARTIRVTIVGEGPNRGITDQYTQADAIMLKKVASASNPTPQTGPTTPAPRCGDGTVDPGEQCDDGNTNDNDACKNNCTTDRIVIDDGDAGFTNSGLARKTSAAAHEGDYMECYHSPFSSAASYAFTDLDTTAAYDVYTTWTPASDLNSNLEFLTSNGGNMTNVRTRINQTIAPVGITHAGRTWQKIAYISLATPYAGNTFYVTGYCTGHGVLDAVMAVKVAPSVCGNNAVESGEECDDGNRDGRDACTAQCKNAVCGDYNVRTGVEQCDDGNANNNDACTATCQTARCGDGTIRTGVEQCDDGNQVNTDGCSNACQPPRCGDQIVQTGEQCDDGNQVNTDDCRNNCTRQGCGNGTVDPGEQCDDGNTNNDDACTNLCKTATCGDGFRQGQEQCDDGNRQNYGDGCNNACQTQVCGNGVRENPETCDVSSYWPSWMYPECIRQTCQLRNTSYCGNGLREATTSGSSEDCDDGNLVDTDSCTNMCETYPYVCGNGRKQGTELCDDGNLVNGDGCSSTCQTQAITVGCGNGVLDPGQEVCDNGTQNVPGHSTQPGQCTVACVRTGDNVCGNSRREGIEQCDDGNSIQTDGCTNGCRTGGVCGNAVTDANEQCDDGNTVNNDACTAQCKNAVCGDMVIRVGVEQCDDGNTNNGDGCSSTCQVLAIVCGNGTIQSGEQCDDGNTVASDACTHFCQNARCGDGIRRTGAGAEACDDGNTVDGDLCNATCTAVTTPGPSCGNGTIQAGEQCDDGNTINTDICTATCQNARCGDGIHRPATEGCDDGNTNDNDACRNDCTLPPAAPTCGNGIIQTGETCDDGNRVDADSCRNDCTLPPFSPLCDNYIVDPGETCVMPQSITNRRIPGSDPPQECDVYCHLLRCGDGIRHAQLGEQCDDGNQVNTDGCSNRCQLNVTTPAPRCGDGTVNQANEQCDDGNTVDTDACRNNCTTNTTTPPAPTGAVITLRNVDIGQTHRAVANQEITVMRFKITANAQGGYVRRLEFTGNGGLNNGLLNPRLFVDTNGDGTGDQLVATGTMQNGVIVFTSQIQAPGGSDKSYDLRLKVSPTATYYTTHPVYATPLTSLKVDFNTASSTYFRATQTNNVTQLFGIALNGTCPAAQCSLAVVTGPTITHTFKKAANLTVAGINPQPEATTILAGGESQTILETTMAVSDDESVSLQQMAFAVQGSAAVELVKIYVNGVFETDATISQCANMTFVPGPIQAGPIHFEQKYCAIFDAFLARNHTNVVEARVVVKEASTQWQPGTQVKLTLLTTPDGYVKAVGDTSGIWLTQSSPASEGGRVTIFSPINSTVHTAE